MPRKTFVNGQVLTDTDLNTYLMDQAVQTFASSAARSSALPGPTEGMVSYLADTNSLEFWTGSAWEVVNNNTASVPLNTVTTQGDLIVASGSAAVTRLGRGTAGQVLTANSTALEWSTPSVDIPLNTVTAAGDLIVANGSASVQNLAAGIAGQVLKVATGGTSLEWGAAGGGGYSNFQLFTSSGTFTPSAGIEKVDVFISGGGGGGASGSIALEDSTTIVTFSAGGGAGSDITYLQNYSVTAGSAYSVVIGAGGSGGTAITTVGDGSNNSDPGIAGTKGNVSSFNGVESGFGQGATAPQSPIGSTNYSQRVQALSVSGQTFFSRTGANGNISTPSSFSGMTNTPFGSIAHPNITAGTGVDGSIGTQPAGSTALAIGTATVGVYGLNGGGGAGGGATTSALGGVYNAGSAVSGGGGGGGGASYGTVTSMTNGTYTAGAGGAAQANSGAGGGGGGGIKLGRVANTKTAISGAGGNGGSGYVLVLY